MTETNLSNNQRQHMLAVFEHALAQHRSRWRLSPRGRLAYVTWLAVFIGCFLLWIFLNFWQTLIIASCAAFYKSWETLLKSDYPLSWAELIRNRIRDAKPFVHAPKEFEKILQALEREPLVLPEGELMDWLAAESVLLHAAKPGQP